MAISEAMFAQGLGAYIREHEKDFEKFLCELYPDALDGWDIHGLEEGEGVLLFLMTKRSQDGSTLRQCDYAITIKRLST